MTIEEEEICEEQKTSPVAGLASVSRVNRQLRLKTNRKGSVVSVVRELYLRNDVPCRSSLCSSSCDLNRDKDTLLPIDVSHYVIPGCQIARDYMEIWEMPDIRGIIFPQTVYNSVQYEGTNRQMKRLKNLLGDPRKGSVLFYNEFHQSVYCERQPGEEASKWQTRCCYQVAKWFYHHLEGQKPIIMVTHDLTMVEELGYKTLNVFVLTMEDYLESFWQDIPGTMDLFESLKASLDVKQKGTEYLGYLPTDVLEAGIKSGRLIKGFLNVNKHDAQREAFLRRSGSSETKHDESDILIHGMAHRNRAIHGDIVVVELLPQSEWRGQSLNLKDNNDGAEEEEPDTSSVMPNGKVVGILQRNCLDYAASLASEENNEVESQKSLRRADRVLVIPWDYRIPKIRICTRQIDTLKDQRFVVRIDSWELGSQYPNGHFVRTLGAVGDQDTEIATILVENNIIVGNFSDMQLQELPKVKPDHPWCVPEEEISKRRDLRESHLVFSIDPKGCEDVDDTLSVKYLSNGNIELGVHIADVTYFIKERSLTDLEAKARASTVYLADRRYDMLPSVLSSNLCSLISGVDRCAVSVIWEMDSEFNVLDVWYGRTLIKSCYKLFYEMAQAIFDGKMEEEIIAEIPELTEIEDQKLAHERVVELREAICTLMQISRTLKANRKQRGALELDGMETRALINQDKNIDDIILSEHLEIHDTVAECMILANHWVGRKISSSFPNHSLLRHHPLPRQEFFDNLVACASSQGFTIDTSSSKALADSLDKCVDANDVFMNRLLRMMAVQAMSQAAYFSTGSINRDQFFHYGLALDVYTHFTSPIRRYADILVHRQLLAAIGTKDDGLTLLNNQELQDLCDHMNQKHRAAQNAQRDSQEMFQAFFFRDRSADSDCFVADAIVVQLRANGVVVFLPRYGLKAPVYVKNKEGKVLHIPAGKEVAEWTHGAVTRGENHVTVISRIGKQLCFTLFQHITVKISLEPVFAHKPNVRLELVSNKSLLHFVNAESSRPKSPPKDLFKAETSSNIVEDSKDADSKNSLQKLSKEYGQSTVENSLYHIFESFQEMGLMPA